MEQKLTSVGLIHTYRVKGEQDVLLKYFKYTFHCP